MGHNKWLEFCMLCYGMPARKYIPVRNPPPGLCNKETHGRLVKIVTI